MIIPEEIKPLRSAILSVATWALIIEGVYFLIEPNQLREGWLMGIMSIIFGSIGFIFVIIESGLFPHKEEAKV